MRQRAPLGHSKNRQRTTGATHQVAGCRVAAWLGLVIFTVQSYTNLTAETHQDAALRQNEALDVHSLDVRIELEAITEILSPFERQGALNDLLERASDSTLASLLVQSQDTTPSHVRRELQESLVRRLSADDPAKALGLVVDLPKNHQKLLVEAVFEEWSFHELDEALDHAEQLADPTYRWALQGILSARDDLEEGDRLAIARRFSEEQLLVDLNANALVDQEIENPKSAWNQLMRDYGNNMNQLSEAQREALVHVAGMWIREGGLEAHRNVMRTLSNKEDRAAIVSALLQRFYDEDPARSLAYTEHVANTDREVLNWAVGNWAETDGWTAFQAAQLFDSESTAQSDRMQRSAIIAWAENDAHTLIAALPKLPASLFEWSRETALLKMRYTYPESVPEFLDGIEDEREVRMIVDNLVMDWARIDPLAAYEWTMSGDKSLKAQSGGSRVGTIFYEAVRRNPHSALPMALALPLDENGIGPEAVVIGSMTTEDVDLAIDMMESARNSATRTDALSSIATNLVRRGNSDRAIQLISKESEEDQFTHYESVAWIWALTHSEDLLSKLDSVPFDEVKRKCARYLLIENSIEPFMTKEDMEKIKEYVAEKDRDLMKHTVD